MDISRQTTCQEKIYLRTQHQVQDQTEMNREMATEAKTASEIRQRYLQSGLDDVSDPEYWQELYHFDSEAESDGSNKANR